MSKGSVVLPKRPELDGHPGLPLQESWGVGTIWPKVRGHGTTAQPSPWPGLDTRPALGTV